MYILVWKHESSFVVCLIPYACFLIYSVLCYNAKSYSRIYFCILCCYMVIHSSLTMNQVVGAP